MKYTDLVEQTKRELEKATDTKAKLAKLYRQAQEKYKEQHTETVESINNDYFKKKNAAYAEKKLNDKNTDEFLSSRGLTYSGESAQAKLNSNINLNNTLSSLATDHSEGLRVADAQKDEALLKLEAEYAEKQAQAEKELYESALKTAESQIKYGDVSFNQASGETGTGESGEAEDAKDEVKPAMTPIQFANAIVKRYGEDGKIEGGTQNANIHRFLKEAKEKYGFSDEYMTDVISVLDALGYDATTDDEARIASVVDASRSAYSAAYNKAYTDGFYLFTDSIDARNNYANNRANIEKLDYIYERCRSMEEFKTACKLLNMTEYRISAYLETVKRREGTSGQVKLNSKD